MDPGPLATRGEAVGAWTGTDIIIVGGLLIDRYQPVVDGAAYRPATKQWRAIAPRPSPERIFTGVWTGRELIVWGGGGATINPGDPLSNGDAYDPERNSWRTISANPFVFPALPPEAPWTGSQVLLWAGGSANSATAPPGALYDPRTDRWNVIPPPALPGVLSVGAGVWTGKKWAALTLTSPAPGAPAVDGLALFDPTTTTWTAATPPRSQWGSLPPDLLWTGKEVFVIGQSAALAYDPATDRWRNQQPRKVGPATPLDAGGSLYAARFQAIALVDGRVVAQHGGVAPVLDVYDPANDRWSRVGSPGGRQPAAGDVTFVSTGRSVVLFGLATDGTMVLPGEPNVAWTWSPTTATRSRD